MKTGKVKEKKACYFLKKKELINHIMYIFYASVFYLLNSFHFGSNIKPNIKFYSIAKL